MIRPRPGSFVYSEAEVEVMLEDISAFKSAGASGIVFGCLLGDGSVDVDTAARYAPSSSPSRSLIASLPLLPSDGPMLS